MHWHDKKFTASTKSAAASEHLRARTAADGDWAANYDNFLVSIHY